MFVDITKYGPKYAEMPNLSQNFYVPHKLLQFDGPLIQVSFPENCDFSTLETWCRFKHFPKVLE